MEPLLFADDDSFWFETMRTLGASAWGGAEPGEVFTTAEQISAGDYDGWHDQWLATAVRVDAEARQALETGHRISARDGLLRANNYYRAAEFFLHENQEDPRINHAYKLARDCFHAAAPLFDPPIQIVEIPYEGTVLHGYFYPAAGSEADDGPRPTMVLHNGFDGTCEELHYSGAMAGQERGYHVLTFDGPGQPAARHLDGLVFRADWENVVGPVLDWLLQRPEVDASRIGLLGLSMGGLLAPRAAAFDDRIAACVAFDGVYDLGAAGRQQDAWDQGAGQGCSQRGLGTRGRRDNPGDDGRGPQHSVGCHPRPIRHGRALAARLLRELPGLHTGRRSGRANHLPDPGPGRGRGHFLRRPARAVVRPLGRAPHTDPVHQC